MTAPAVEKAKGLHVFQEGAKTRRRTRTFYIVQEEDGYERAFLTLREAKRYIREQRQARERGNALDQ